MTARTGRRTPVASAEGAAAYVGGEPATTVARLVHLAVATEDASAVLAAAERELRRPLALVDLSGEALGHAPADDRGRRALAVARAVIADRLGARTGWRVVSVEVGSSRLGLLAIGPCQGHVARASPVVDVLVPLLADQLRRAGLLRTQRRAFVRRLLGAGRVDVERARREAGALGLELADAYRPSLVGWRGPSPQVELVEALAGHAGRLEPDGLTAVVGDWLVLLAPAGHGSRWPSAVVGRARALAPEALPQALAAERDVGLGCLGTELARLAWVWRLDGPSWDDAPVLSARRYALAALLGEHVHGPEARAFVEDRIGRLTEWDRTHGTALVDVLEAALDHPRHEVAASRCFMHRNTFRRRLRQAREVLGEDLADPDVRLAVHVALKLRRWLDGAASRRPVI